MATAPASTLRLDQPVRVNAPGPELSAIAEAIPASYFMRQRWFAGKGQRIINTQLADYTQMAEQPPLFAALLDVFYAAAATERYYLLLLIEPAEERRYDAAIVWDRNPGSQAPEQAPLTLDPGLPILILDAPNGRFLLSDGFHNSGCRLLLFERLRRGARIATRRGAIHFEPFGLSSGEPDPKEARLLGLEQSNTSVLFDSSWILKNYRKIAPGESRDLEIGRFLSSQTAFRGAPLTVGSIEYQVSGEPDSTLAVLQQFVPNRGDGWSYVLRRLDELCTELAKDPQQERFFLTPAGHEKSRHLLEEIATLGQVTGEMHAALGSRPDAADFAPESVTSQDVAAWQQDLRQQAERAFVSVRSHLDSLSRSRTHDSQLRPQASEPRTWDPRLGTSDSELATRASPEHLRRFLEAKDQLFAKATDILAQLNVAGLTKIQIHGDYHLGQVLRTEDGFTILDFEGEPLRPLEERRGKQAPARDAAGMLRSFDYAVVTSLRRLNPRREPPPAMRDWGARYQRRLGQAFVRSWKQALNGSGLIPEEPANLDRLLSLFQLSKALYELNYELSNRPNWVLVPLQGIERLLAR